MSVASWIAVVATVLQGLGAGILLAFAAGVMPGLRRVDDAVFVRTMRAVNRAVLNPAFLAPLLLPAPAAATIAAFASGRPDAGWVLAAASVVHLAGVVGVTVAGSVPRNVALERSTEADAATRRAFESPWVRLNLVRTVAAVLATLLCAIGVALLG